MGNNGERDPVPIIALLLVFVFAAYTQSYPFDRGYGDMSADGHYSQQTQDALGKMHEYQNKMDSEEQKIREEGEKEKQAVLSQEQKVKEEEKKQVQNDDQERLDQARFIQGLIDAGTMRRATPDDYSHWVRGYLKNGGNHTYNDYSGVNREPSYIWLVAQRDFTLRPLDDFAVYIIVPKGIYYLGNQSGFGENTMLYFTDNYQTVWAKNLSPGRVPVPIFLMDTPDLIPANEKKKMCVNIAKDFYNKRDPALGCPGMCFDC